MRRGTAALLLAALFAMGPSFVCFAQAETRDRTRAPVTVTAQRDLDFADVLPGVNKAVTITDLTSGKWLIQGDPWTLVDITFPGLPATLTDGANTIPIVYSGTDAGYYATDDPGSATTFDPSVGTTALLGAAGELYVWIGGTVQPDEADTAGNYTGTITLDAVYN